MSIQFFFIESNISLQQRSRLKAFIPLIFKREKKSISQLNYIFCSDDYLLQINRQYLNHDYYTDIITFDLSEKPDSVDGEIYISVDRIRDNAIKLNETIKHELHRVIFHGALHLCGYKDKTKSDAQTMRAMEDHYINLYFK